MPRRCRRVGGMSGRSTGPHGGATDSLVPGWNTTSPSKPVSRVSGDSGPPARQHSNRAKLWILTARCGPGVTTAFSMECRGPPPLYAALNRQGTTRCVGVNESWNAIPSPPRTGDEEGTAWDYVSAALSNDGNAVSLAPLYKGRLRFVVLCNCGCRVSVGPLISLGFQTLQTCK